MSRGLARLPVSLATAALLLGFALGAGAGSALAHGTEEHGAAAPPPSGSQFEPPAPGTYELPPIQRVARHELLDPDGDTSALLPLADGEVCVVSFIYRSCADSGGCPMALAVLKRLDAELAERPEVAARARLVTVSFDPERDTPEAMGELARNLAPRTRWTFLTPASPAALAPVLDDYGQDVRPLASELGQPSGQLGHVLKVFLVDSDHRVRNIYSTGFLRADLLLNDILTLLAEDDAGAER